MNYNLLTGYQPPELTFLETDLTEPELLFRRIASEKNEKPSSFPAPEHPYIYYCLKYEKPDSSFTGLKRLILEIRRGTGMRSGYTGIVGIDVSSWRSHESEEYFQIFLKYLYDNSTDWKLYFICCNYTEKEFLTLQLSCLNYFILKHQKVFIYTTDSLNECITHCFSSLNLSAGKEAVDLLADALQAKVGSSSRSLQIIRRIVYEVSRLLADTGTADPHITPEVIKKNLSDSSGFLNILSRLSTAEENGINKETGIYEKAV